MKTRTRTPALVSTLAVLLCLTPGDLSAQRSDLARFLPGPTELGACQPEAEPQVFKGDELFAYIDGGADIYLEYGFLQVLVQDYRSPSGHGISLEIFQMTSEESAYGIYTFKTAPGGTEIDVGDDGRLADYYLNVWKGSYVLTLTGLDQNAVTEEELLDLARAAAKRIPGGATVPWLAGRLPDEGLRPQSLKFFKGPLGLANADRLFSGSMLGFERGIKGDYMTGYSVVLLEFRDEPRASERYRQALHFISAAKKFSGFESWKENFAATDEKGKAVRGELRGRFIILTAGAGSRDLAEEVIAGLVKKLRPIP